MSANGWTMKKHSGSFYAKCSRCHESIRAGEFYERRGSEYRHRTACAPIAAPAPVVVAPVASTEPRFYRCPRCGVAGRAGRHPFSTLPHVACDDCL